jgi:predicted RNA-binding protein Jag
MKSLVEEASSVVKAIEKAWNRAGCPQTFSVKVFETPETNFFGFTKKSAKVGIFFEEEPAPQQKKYVSQNRDQRSQGTNRPQSKGRTDASSYSREREEKEDDTVQVESRRAHHTSRPPHQGQRSYDRTSEPRPTASPLQKETVTQRPEPVQHEDRQDRQPSRERQQRPTGGRPPRTNDRNDRERDEQPRQARTDAPVVEQEQRREPRQEPRREYEPRQEQEPRREREYEPRREREQDAREPRGDYEDNRREGGSRDRNSRSGDRRSSSRGGDRDRGGRSPRPERAQRHEFDEQRPMFNNGSSEQSQPTNEQHQAPAHSAPEMANAPASLAPQKKVLKVSGRRYSAPVKKTDE